MDAVEHGQSFTVTRDGHRIGELIPLRRRPPGALVFSVEGGVSGVAADGRTAGASAGWAGDAEVAELMREVIREKQNHSGRLLVA